MNILKLVRGETVVAVAGTENENETDIFGSLAPDGTVRRKTWWEREKPKKIGPSVVTGLKQNRNVFRSNEKKRKNF